MELYVLSEDFQTGTPVFEYDTLLWTERYLAEGDFELYAQLRDDMPTFKLNQYIQTKTSSKVMIIERMRYEYTVDDGAQVIYSGRSLESILRRRVTIGEATLNGNFHTNIKKLIEDNIINPTNVDRKIEGFIFRNSTDSRILELDITGTYYCDNLYDIIQAACSTHNVGFRVILNDDNNFEFELYMGVDRSYDQEENPYVVFSPTFNNLYASSYDESIEDLANVAIVAGPGSGNDRPLTTVGTGEGLMRREMYTDARDSSTDLDYYQQKGEEALAERNHTTIFDGDMNTEEPFKMGVDFDMGDIVQIINMDGDVVFKSRIAELIRSVDADGYSSIPTFVTIESTL